MHGNEAWMFPALRVPNSSLLSDLHRRNVLFGKVLFLDISQLEPTNPLAINVLF
jgi:hypothetical protein